MGWDEMRERSGAGPMQTSRDDSRAKPVAMKCLGYPSLPLTLSLRPPPPPYSHYLTSATSRLSLPLTLSPRPPPPPNPHYLTSTTSRLSLPLTLSLRPPPPPYPHYLTSTTSTTCRCVCHCRSVSYVQLAA
ncbi:hypothetical protein Pcinc_026545 [Petrolisthes cinctipes]|uniref:Uncharacterized protein n=1 Tax=Petrolisthes cinctipes TaxID=88211 RepID=A0AAE1F734_PETCI|nr:hypothetical protein Pcinc_026545 [Petrolisthes cinctipes]